MERFKRLKPYARTMRQTELLELVISSNGNMREAARALGIHHSTIVRSIQRIERTAALQGFSPDHDMTHAVPDSHFVKGTSTLYKRGEDGTDTVALQWVKTNAKLQDELRCLREFAEGLAETLEPAETVPQAGLDWSNSLTVYPLADIHLGMLAWAPECGEDYDLKIASNLIRRAADILTGRAEPSAQAIVANLGDFWHFDDDSKRTAASGAELDGDGRWSKAVRLGVDVMRHFIEAALKRHEHVHVINSIGNHDGQTALVLPLILEPYYVNEPRVTIETAPRFYHYYEFGKNLLGFHHGHRTKPADLPELMVADMREAVGRTEFSHWLTGHIHHETKEYRSCLVESFRTLASKDAYHAGAGYRSLRDIQSITYHPDYGEYARSRVSCKLLQTLGDSDKC